MKKNRISLPISKEKILEIKKGKDVTISYKMTTPRSHWKNVHKYKRIHFYHTMYDLQVDCTIIRCDASMKDTIRVQVKL